MHERYIDESAQEVDDSDWEVFQASLDSRVHNAPDLGIAGEVALAEKLEDELGLTPEEAFQAIYLGQKQQDNQ